MGKEVREQYVKVWFHFCLNFLRNYQSKEIFIQFGKSFQEKSNELFGRWKDESLLKKIGKGLILFSSSAFFVLSFYTLYGMIKGFTLVSSDNLVSVIVGSIIAIISIVINISASLGGFAKYSSKNNFFSRFAGIYVSVQVTLLVLVLT